MTRTTCIFAALAIAGTSARARPYAGETPEDKLENAAILEADRAPQWEGATAFDVGTFHTGPIYDFAYGLELRGGVRLNRVAIYGDYTLLSLSNDTSSHTTTAYAGGDGSPPPSTHPDGLVQRFGLSARYSIGRFITAAGGAGLAGDFWIEAGLGEQLLRWNAGGALQRGDVSFGVGAQMGGRGSEHHGAYFLGIRFTVAHSPAAYESTAVTCAGPCDTATPPLGLDKSVLFTTGIVFGS